MKRQMYERTNDGIANVDKVVKHVLFTHTDLDGAGCAVVFMLAFKDGDIYYCNNGSDIDDCVLNFIRNNRSDEYVSYDMYIADNSVSKDTAKIIDAMMLAKESTINVRLLDHHASALRLNEYEWATVDVSKCGTMLMYNELKIPPVCNTPSLNMFCKNVQDRDLWTWEENGNIKAGDSLKIHSALLYNLSCRYGCPKIERNADIYAAKISGKDVSKKAMKELASLK